LSDGEFFATAARARGAFREICRLSANARPGRKVFYWRKSLRNCNEKRRANACASLRKRKLSTRDARFAEGALSSEGRAVLRCECARNAPRRMSATSFGFVARRLQRAEAVVRRNQKDTRERKETRLLSSPGTTRRAIGVHRFDLESQKKPAEIGFRRVFPWPCNRASLPRRLKRRFGSV
jgi:hypothetical protein